MNHVNRALSSVLLACGIALVFFGLTAALGFTPGSVIAGVAAIAALLYAGGVWFGGAPAQFSAPGADTVIVFDRHLRIAGGRAAGVPILSRFPEPIRPELEMRCQLALQGEHTWFSCEHEGKRISFDISPVQAISGVVLYGVVVAGQGRPLPAATPKPLTTVA